MKIIKHGKLHEYKRVISCRCGCDFEIEYNDFKDTIVWNSLFQEYEFRVLCPECGHTFIILPFKGADDK